MDTAYRSIIVPGHVSIAEVVDKIEAQVGVKLMARKVDDVVHGFVNCRQYFVDDTIPETEFEVHLYQSNEAPTDVTNPEIKAAVDEIVGKLPVKEQKKAREKQTMLLGGHTTTFVKAIGIKGKIEKLSSLDLKISARIEKGDKEL